MSKYIYSFGSRKAEGDKNNKRLEFNPMLGHRGCCLGVTYPEITEMQVKAVLKATWELSKEGVSVLPEVMVPSDWTL